MAVVAEQAPEVLIKEVLALQQGCKAEILCMAVEVVVQEGIPQTQ